MAAGDIALRVVISASAGAALAEFARVGIGGEGVAGKLAAMGVVAGAAVIGFGVAAVKMAGDFQQSVTKLYTTAGEAKSNLDMVSQGILAMAGQVGIGAQKLVDAMYWVESAGFHGSAGLTVLRIAAEGAKAENSDLIPVAHALTGVLNTYASTGITAAQAMNVLIASTGQGAMTLADLSGAISNVLPAANKFHLNLIDITTAIATMTNQNDNAASAATHLRQVILALESPAKAGAKSLADIGLTTQQVSDAMKTSLPGAIQMIIDHLGKRFPEGSAAYNTALKNIAGGNKQLLGLLELSGGSLKKWEEAIKNVKGAVDAGGNSVMGWNDIQGNFNFKMDQARAAVGSLFIQIGSNLLPILTPLVGKIADLVTNFTKWLNSGHSVTDALGLMGKNSQVILPIVSGLAVAVGVGLAIAFWNLAAAVIAATWPFLLIAGAVAGVVAIFVHFYQTSAPFRAFIDGLVSGFKQLWQMISANFIPTMQQAGSVLKQVGGWLQANVWPILQQIGAFLKSVFQPVWQSLVNLWTTQLMPLFKQLWGALQPLAPVLMLVGKIVGGIIVVAFGVFVGLITGVIKALGGFLQGLATIIGGVVQFITGFVQVISGIVTFIWDLLHGNFSKLGADLGMIWQGIVNMFQGAWNTIKGIFQAAWGAISGFVSGLVQGVIGFFQHLWNELVGHSIIPDMINGIISFFASLPGKLFAIIGNLITYLLDKWNMLKAEAMAIVQGMVNGIGNAFSGLGSTIHGIWDGIVGGIKSAINWIIGLINNFIRGIDSIGVDIGPVHIHPHIPTIPLLAAGGFVEPGQWAIAGDPGPNSELVYGGRAGATVFSHSQSVALMSRSDSYALQNRSGGSATIVVQAAPVMLDKRQVGQILFTYQKDELRRQGGVRNR